jgi:MFS transporter, FHS family, L-fucose permease
VIPFLYGYLGDIFTLHSAYAILLVIYLFILYYATLGHKAGSKVTRPMP